MIQPLAEAHGIGAYFVRAKDTHGEPLPSLPEYHLQLAQGKRKGTVLLPMYGSKGGRIQQRCTQRYKITAIRQQLRALGATTQRSAQALHMGEARRMRGAHHRMEGGWHTWNDLDGPNRAVKWCSHYYPLIDLRMNRQQVDEALERAGVPYVRFSGCEGCPNAGASRWMRRTPESLARSASLEHELAGLYLTDQRAPLPIAVERLQARRSLWGDDDTAFECGNGYCGL